MPTRFFDIPSKQLKHHTVSLLPDVERIIRTSEAHFFENITKDAGDIANFSISLNLIILARFTTLLTMIRKDQKLDPDATQFLVDLIDHRRAITDKDLGDYKKALNLIAEQFKKTHN